MALLLTAPFAFTPGAARVSPSVHQRPARVATLPAMSAIDAASVIRNAAALPAMYAMMSANEYMTHRYFQHLEFNRPESLLWLKSIIAKVTGDETPPKLKGDGHVEHHAETCACPPPRGHSAAHQMT